MKSSDLCQYTRKKRGSEMPQCKEPFYTKIATKNLPPVHRTLYAGKYQTVRGLLLLVAEKGGIHGKSVANSGPASHHEMQ